ncbi:MAG: hypothetical protein A2519_21200 [Candidatus Raymondbacteria bacterium RIFOXYD12_FULL_49_13]|uniref:Secretion system C-terminal sorting domain-containing protein n=1 Tax=Candidatus Raymondbacteria bacterium RIFOXYD12_FULL_49_13 TaxID=1817890 RepID=A0A1F7FLK2_UNCRA|nr:MAG: hypothetical protein A2519_21200 [Candidatus Raymondbacteria bacterium RIFOXYD12_FULL_49_13]
MKSSTCYVPALCLMIMSTVFAVLVSAAPTPPPAGSVTDRTYTAHGQVHTYKVTVPYCFDPSKSWPLISANQMQSEFLTDYCKVALQVPYITLPNCYNDMEDILDIAKDINIDPYRVYQTGFSQGGHISLQSAWQYPHNFAAVVPSSPDLRLPNQWFYFNNIQQLRNVPVRIVQGDMDDYIDGTLQVYETMLAASCPVEMMTFHAGHSYMLFTALPEFNRYIRTFFDANVLDPFPKTVYHCIEFCQAASYSRAFWVNGKLAKSYHGGLFGVNPVFQVTADSANNLITIDSADPMISGFDFYLDSHLVDITKPVNVVKGGQSIFLGAIPPDGKVPVTLYTTYVEPPSGSSKGGSYPAQYVCNSEEKVLWQKLDSIRCAVFGVCNQPPIATEASNKGRNNGLALSVFPNPFNPRTRIAVSPPYDGQAAGCEKVLFEIYNLHGKLVQKLLTAGGSADERTGITWDASGLPSGVYVIRALAGNATVSRTVTFLQ